MAIRAVYRIQHREDGSGPYFGSRAVGSALDYSSSRHPEPQNDGISWKSMASDQLCGFGSEEAVFGWFSESDLNFLHSMGFVLAVYSVAEEKIAQGKSQVLFPEASELRETVSIGELLSERVATAAG